MAMSSLVLVVPDNAGHSWKPDQPEGVVAKDVGVAHKRAEDAGGDKNRAEDHHADNEGDVDEARKCEPVSPLCVCAYPNSPHSSG